MVGISMIVLGTIIEMKKTKLRRNIIGIVIGRIGLLLILARLPVILNHYVFPYSEWMQAAGALFIFIGLLSKKDETKER